MTLCLNILLIFLKYLKIKNVSNIDYSNPFSITYLHEIINNIANIDIEINNVLEVIDENLKDLKSIRCDKCFNLLYIFYDRKEKTTTLTYTNDKTHIRNNVKKIRDLREYELICSECKQIIVIYNNNYKFLK